MTRTRLVVALALLLMVGAFFAAGGSRLLDFGTLRLWHDEAQALYRQQPALVIGGYFAAYVLMASLSLPGTVVLTLLGGAVFGLLLGTVLVSFASAVGATLAMWTARYLLRDAVQRRFGGLLAEIDRGIERDGAFYLFTLRMVPLFPFFLINLLMGLTAMRSATFYAVSQAGMLAVTVVYVNAGTQLARLSEPADVLSVPLLLSLAGVGLLPLLARRALGAFTRSGGR